VQVRINKEKYFFSIFFENFIKGQENGEKFSNFLSGCRIISCGQRNPPGTPHYTAIEHLSSCDQKYLVDEQVDEQVDGL